MPCTRSSPENPAFSDLSTFYRFHLLQQCRQFPGYLLQVAASRPRALSLATHLTNKGWSVTVLSRHPPRRSGPWSHISWDARTLGEWSRTLEGSCGLVNLVGRSVDCVKTPDHQDEIIRSRTEATRALGLAMRS